jgi:hypothetical protein
MGYKWDIDWILMGEQWGFNGDLLVIYLGFRGIYIIGFQGN